MTIATKTATLIRARQDLQAFPRDGGLERQWVVKDPVSFSHFLFTDQELFLLELFDGERSLDEVRHLWQRHFCTRSLTSEQLEMLTHRFIRDKLVIVEQFGAGVRLHQDESKTRQSQLAMKLSSPLVVKLGGVDPRGVLNGLGFPGQLLFSRPVIIFNLTIAVLVLVYFIGHFELIAERAGTLAEFFSVKNLLLMSIIIFVVKILHELGHAVACRKYGGECFEIGVLLLAFFPTLYCDVTDAWTFAERWKRVMVSFAGIYVEIILAASGVVLWLLTEPGLANTVFFNLAVMGSVNTLFVNGNPLLKYDGYYIVSDLFEQPNLSENAKRSFRRWLTGFVFDVSEEPVASYAAQTSSWLTLFGFCSMLYRTFVIVSITLGVSLLLKHLEFGAVGDGIVLLLLGTIGIRMLKQRPKIQRLSWRRISIGRSLLSLTLLGLIGWIGFVVPLPSYRYCQFSVEDSQSVIIYASRDGRLTLDVAPYSNIQLGDQVGRIHQPDLLEQQHQTQAQLENLNQKSKRLVLRFDQSPTVASDLQLLKNEIQKIESQLQSLEVEKKSLRLTAPLAGMVRPFPLPPTPPDQAQGLPVMEGTLFDVANRNTFVRRGQPILVIEGGVKKLVSYLGEKDVEFLEIGQSATLRFDPIPDQNFPGTIEEIIEVDVKLDESEAVSSGLETFVDQIGRMKTLQTPYRVIIAMENLPDDTPTGGNGRARITVPRQTAAGKIWFLIERWWQERNY